MKNKEYPFLLTLAVALFSCFLFSCSSSSSSSTDNDSPKPNPDEASSLQGSLYAATSKPGKVYLYNEVSTGSTAPAWVAISDELGVAVDALVIYEGQLYAAASQNELDGMSIIYRYGGEKQWSKVSSVFYAKIGKFAVFNGRLYASARNPFTGTGELYKYDGDLSWTMVADSTSLAYGWIGFRNLYSWNGFLYIGDSDTDYIARYDGTTIEQVGGGYGNGIETMKAFQGRLFAGTYDAEIYSTDDGVNFTQQYSSTYPSNIWSMQTYSNSLYVGMATSAGGVNKEMLSRWEGANLKPVWENTVTGDDDGVLSMVTNSTTLYFGTGAPSGYFSGPSTGIVYAFDGQNASAISGSLGETVTQLLIGELAPSPSLEIASAVVKPTTMLPGGTFFAYITLRNNGSKTAYISQGAFTKISGGPSGWTADFVDTGVYGAPSTSSTSLQPGETRTVVAAVTVSCETLPGTYEFKPTLTVSLSGNEVTYTTAPDYPNISIEVREDLRGTEMAEYRHAETAVRHIRAVSRNIANGVITTALNLTYFGIDGVQKTVAIYSTGGYAYRDFSESRDSGVLDQQDNYYKSTTLYAYARKYEDTYEEYATGNYRHDLQEARPFYTFDLTPIPAGSQILSAELIVYTGSGTPYAGDFYVKIYSMENDPRTSAAQTVFDDAGNGTLYVDNLLLQPNATITMSIPPGSLSGLTAIGGGTFSVGIVLNGSLSSKDTYEDNDSTYDYKYSNSSIYTSFGINPVISADTLQFTNPEEALNIVLTVFLSGDYKTAHEIAASINEKYYSLGYWDLEPGKDQCNRNNGNGPKN